MGQSEALTPQVINKTLTSADTEYIVPMPEGTKYFSIQCRTVFAMRFAFEDGKVATPTAPYATIPAGGSYNTPEKMGFAEQEESAHVDEITVADTWAASDTVTLAIGSDSFVVTIGSLTTTAQVATTLKQAWENETLTDTAAAVLPTDGAQGFTIPAEITATVASSVVTLTHDSNGHKFTLVVTEVTAGDGTATEANTIGANGNLYLASSQAAVVAEVVLWKDIRI